MGGMCNYGKQHDFEIDFEEKIRKCPVCENKFDSDSALPKSLPCGHTICNICICNVLTKSSITKCPFDNHEYCYGVFPICEATLKSLTSFKKQGSETPIKNNRLLEGGFDFNKNNEEDMKFAFMSSIEKSKEKNSEKALEVSAIVIEDRVNISVISIRKDIIEEIDKYDEKKEDIQKDYSFY